MTDREKLIELIDKARYGAAEMCHEQGCVGCSHWNDRPHCRNSFIADHLLANGVTFATDTNVGSEWISVEDRLPEDDVQVLACTKHGKAFSAHCKKGKWRVSHSIKITHWMPRPEPPKEE